LISRRIREKYGLHFPAKLCRTNSNISWIAAWKLPITYQRGSGKSFITLTFLFLLLKIFNGQASQSQELAVYTQEPENGGLYRLWGGSSRRRLLGHLHVFLQTSPYSINWHSHLGDNQ